MSETQLDFSLLLPILPNRVLISNSVGQLTQSAVTNLEVAHLNGVTQDIQTTLNSIQSTANSAYAIPNGAVTQTKLATGAVGLTQLENQSITTLKIRDSAVTNTKIDTTLVYTVAGITSSGNVNTSGKIQESGNALIPSGTVMVFYQAASPIGWTKVVTQDDKALRVVSGTGGSAGGTQALSTTISLAHSHTVASHTHTISHAHLTNWGHVGNTGVFGNPSFTGTGNQTGTFAQWGAAGTPSQTIAYDKTADTDTANSGSATPSTDGQLSNVSLAYVDIILCSKN